MAIEAAEPERVARAPETQPLELILARNLVSIVSLPAFLVDPGGYIVFFNEAAAEIIGSRFEETGRLSRAEWNRAFGPFDEAGEPVPTEDLPLTIALREGRPAYGRFSIRGKDEMVEIEAGALPLTGPAGYHGSVVVFWPVGLAAGPGLP
jgi:PAS domain-containing protein